MRVDQLIEELQDIPDQFLHVHVNGRFDSIEIDHVEVSSTGEVLLITERNVYVR